MDRRLSRRTVVAGAGALFALAACGTGAGRRMSLRGDTMGTTWSVTLADQPSELDLHNLQARIAQALDRIDAQMSTWRPDSDLSRFNRSRSRCWQPASPELVAVVAAGLAAGRRSGGAFDVSVGPAVEDWGFGPTGRRALPDDAAQARLRARIGYDRLEISLSRSALRKRLPDVALDLSGIAKGYAVDRLADLAVMAGAEDYLVEIGGEFRASGTGPDGGAWRLGIEKPLAGQIGIHRVLRLRSGALATSGDYRHWFEQDGERYMHIIDPRTGQPAASALASVSVVAATAMEADALATALMVLGPDAGWALARREGIAALFITRIGGGFADRSTPELAPHLEA